MESLISHAFSVWILLALISGALEMLIPKFAFILASVAALVAAVVSLWAGVPIQVGVFTLALIGSLFVLRPFLLKRRHSGHKIHSRSQALNGLKGEVTETIDPDKHTGRITVNGEDWSARSEVVIAAGRVVEVVGSDGIVLLVKEV
jgi:membrane protein implicated in regulation of membrane protease activity